MLEYFKPDPSFVKDLGALLERLNSFGNNYNELNAEIIKKQSHFEKLTNDTYEASKKLTALEARYETLSSEYDSRLDSLESELTERRNAFEKEIAETGIELDVQMESIQSDRIALEERKKELQVLSDQLTQRESDLSIATESLEERRVTLTKKESNLRDFETNLSEIDEKLINESAVIKRTKAEVIRTKARLANDCLILSDKLKEAESLLADAHTRLIEVEAHENKLRNEEKVVTERYVELSKVSQSLKKKEIILNDREQVNKSHVVSFGV